MAEEIVSLSDNAQPKAKTLTGEQIVKEVKPLSSNGFLAFFQRIWRAWLGIWYGFSDKHPKGSLMIKQFVVMFLFSNLVTIWQFIIMAFLPYAFVGLWGTAFVWPAVELPGVLDPAGNQLHYAIFNEPVQYNAAGEVVVGGLGNFVAFEIAVFTAQCINFPLQRNITFKSNGNPVVQAIWYFIGWVLISLFVNAIWGIIQPFATSWGWNETVPVLVQLLKTVITGGVSMVIFFFIFLIIFPDMTKVAKKARAKADALKNSGASADAVSLAELDATRKEEEANLYEARKSMLKASSQATSKAVAYDLTIKNIEKAKTDEIRKKYSDSVDGRIASASEAIAEKYNAMEKYGEVYAKVAEARSARGEEIKGYNPLSDNDRKAIADYKALA